MSLLVRAQPAQRAVNLFLGVLPHAAGVEQDDVGLRRLVDYLVALAAQASHDQLAVEHVHLAADRFDVQLLGHGVFRLLASYALSEPGAVPRRRRSSASSARICSSAWRR